MNSSFGKQVVDRLRKEFLKGETKSYKWRITQLKTLRKMILENSELFKSALAKDLRQTPFVCAFEINSVLEEIDVMLSNLKKWMKPESVAIENLAYFPASGLIYKEPYGVVLIISPWNYPVQLTAIPIVGALAGGNCVCVKPSSKSANVSKTFETLFKKYFDEGIITCVLGGDSKRNDDLLNQNWDLIFYTGNPEVGKTVMQAAAKYLTPVVLELGGKCPVIIDKDCHLDLAVKRLVWGKFSNAGQTCVSPDYVFVHKSMEKCFVEKVVKQVEEFFGKDPQKSKDFARIINEHHVRRLASILEKTPKNDIVIGGYTDMKDHYVSPTVIVNVNENSEVMKSEIFGPILPILTYDNIKDVIKFINDRPKPLALYLFTQNNRTKDYVLQNTSSGGVTINDVMLHACANELPFGGVGYSGIGKYHGKASFDAFTHRKSVLMKSNFLDTSIRYPPYTDSKVKWYNRFNIRVPLKSITKVLIPIGIAIVGYSVYLTLKMRRK